MIDLRSDTVTLPTPAMRAVMAAADVGDDVYGEDPTVNRLQDMAAAITGMEAGLFVPSGTQGNLLGVLSHCERGDEYIAGTHAHTYLHEGGGAAVFGSVQPQPLDLEEDGTLDLHRVESAIKPDDPHYVTTRLLCLENTQNGKALPLDYLPRAAELARRHGLGLHLDGARIFNASVKSAVPVAHIAGHFDTVSFCLSKGLGAPAGSVLCGTRGLIEKAHRWRKVLGGGMRQAGILAAAGVYALENNVNRLADDHANATALAAGLSDVPGVSVDYGESQTNMVFITLADRDPAHLAAALRDNGILVTAGRPMRLVLHLGVSADEVAVVVEAVSDFSAEHLIPNVSSPESL